MAQCSHHSKLPARGRKGGGRSEERWSKVSGIRLAIYGPIYEVPTENLVLLGRKVCTKRRTFERCFPSCYAVQGLTSKVVLLFSSYNTRYGTSWFIFWGNIRLGTNRSGLDREREWRFDNADSLILEILIFLNYNYFPKIMTRKPSIGNLTNMTELYPFLE